MPLVIVEEEGAPLVSRRQCSGTSWLCTLLVILLALGALGASCAGQMRLFSITILGTRPQDLAAPRAMPPKGILGEVLLEGEDAIAPIIHPWSVAGGWWSEVPPHPTGPLRRVSEGTRGRQLLGSKLADIGTATQPEGRLKLGLALDADKHVITTFSLPQLFLSLWDSNKTHPYLALSVALFSGLWPVIAALLTVMVWSFKMSSDIRQGLLLMLKYMAKWCLLDVMLLTLWIPVFRMSLPAGHARMDAEWGASLAVVATVVSYSLLLAISSYERESPPALWEEERPSRKSMVHFHAVFFTLAALSTLLLIAALSATAYEATLTLTYTSGGQPHTSTTTTKHTLLTAGAALWNSGGSNAVVAAFYVLFVTTMPAMFLVSAVVAWVTSPLERGTTDDTSLALSVCNMVGRLVSLDVWLYAYMLTWLRLDDLANALGQGQDFKIQVALHTSGGIYCTTGWVVCLWMMHTLVQYAHSPHQGDEIAGRVRSPYRATNEFPVEPLWSPPSTTPQDLTPLLSARTKGPAASANIMPLDMPQETDE